MGNFCAKCGCELKEGAKFCPSCGTPTSKAGDGEQVTKIKNAATSTKPKSRKRKTSTGSKTTKRTTKKNSNNDYMRNTILPYVLTVIIIMGILWFLGAFDGEILNIPDGRAAYVVENQDCKRYDLSSINKIIMYEGNSRQDCKVEGTSKSGDVFALNGKWEKKRKDNFPFRDYYALDFNNFYLLINRDKRVSYHKGSVSQMDKSLEKNVIGVLKPITSDEENKISSAFSKKKEEQDFKNSPIIGSKDVDFVKKKLPGSVWTFTDEYQNVYWTKLVFSKDKCKVYDAMPKDGKWTFTHETPYSVVEKRLDDGKRYVFVYLKYNRNGEELPFPMGINITQGAFIYGGLGAIGFINEKDYVWD